MARRSLAAVFGLIVLAAAALLCRPLSPQAAAAPNSVADQSPLSIAIGVSDDRGDPTYLVGDAKRGVIHVVITNTSNQPVKLWRTWCSWGFFNLSLAITDDQGRKSVLKPATIGWDKNYPDAFTLAAGAHYVVEVPLGVKPWPAPKIEGDPNEVKAQIVAVYASREDDESKKQNVWSGRITSKPQVAMLKFKK